MPATSSLLLPLVTSAWAWTAGALAHRASSGARGHGWGRDWPVLTRALMTLRRSIVGCGTCPAPSSSSSLSMRRASLPVVGSGARERCALRPTVYKLDSSSALRPLARRRVRRARALRPTANCLQARLQLGPTPACPSSGPARASAAPYGQLSTSSTPARPYARLPVVGSGARERCALRPTVYKLDSSSALRPLARRRVRRARALRPTANRRYFSSSCLTWAITWGAWIGLVM